MAHYIVVETEAGLEVAEVAEGKTADDAAAVSGGVIVDSGPYKTYDQAKDAMEQMPDDEKEQAKYRD